MPSIEKTIKLQYAKFFLKSDWTTFKRIAEFYLERAAFLKTKDFKVEHGLELMARNIQKRLFLGIACELLVKACYLKYGYVINKSKIVNGPRVLRKGVRRADLNKYDTYTLGPLITEINQVVHFSDWPTVERGLKILKVFRNKEGHVAVFWHGYEAQDYRDIETSLKTLYLDVFDENLQYTISMADGEKARFSISEN